MKIREVNENKQQFIALLLLADEQENMMDHYLEKESLNALDGKDVLLVFHAPGLPRGTWTGLPRGR